MESSKAAVISIGKMSKRLKHQLLEFDSNEKEFVLGRNREAQCMILDVNVSRRHASLKHLSGQGWSITDNKVITCFYLQFDINPEARIYIGFLLQTICFEDICDILILFCFRVQMECT